MIRAKTIKFKLTLDMNLNFRARRLKNTQVMNNMSKKIMNQLLKDMPNIPRIKM